MRPDRVGVGVLGPHACLGRSSGRERRDRGPGDDPLPIRRGPAHRRCRGAARADGGNDGMKFGITLKPDHRFDRSVYLARRAEANGFSYGWMFDSHVLWREPYPLLTLMAV